MITPQEKTYQQIENLFSATRASEPPSSLPADTNSENNEPSTPFFPSNAVKKSIEIICQNKKYVYHLDEVLRRKWSLWEVTHGDADEPAPEPEPEPDAEEPGTEEPAPESEEPEPDTEQPEPEPDTEQPEPEPDTEEPEPEPEAETKPEMKQMGGKSSVFWGGAVENDNGTPNTPTDNSFRLRFCLFTINTQAIVPFLEYWLVPDAQNASILTLPEARFTPSSDLEVETEEEEEHAEFLDACREKFMAMGIINEEQEETLNTERMEKGYHGYLVSTKEPNTVFVFYQIEIPSNVSGTQVILDEIINLQKSVNTPIDNSICTMFYENPEVLYIYGSPVNPIDSLLYGENSEYDETNEAAQEIPYCLYLCQDKAKFSEEAQEGKAVETITGNILGLEEEHFMSPRDKYELSAIGKGVKRCEDEYGYFYYFTNQQIGEIIEKPTRYAVFVYNTDYRLDKATMDILKSLDLENRLVGGEHWKWDFHSEDWKGGGGGGEDGKVVVEEEPSVNIPSIENNDSEEEIAEEVPEETAEEETAEEETAEEEDVYATVYFQREGYPLWCIKHRICFTSLDEDKIEKEK